MRLANSLVPGANSVQLEEQPLESTRRGHFSEKKSLVFETLHFAVPPRARIRAFNEITVVLIPDAGHRKIGPKIAIEQFALLPRGGRRELVTGASRDGLGTRRGSRE